MSHVMKCFHRSLTRTCAAYAVGVGIPRHRCTNVGLTIGKGAAPWNAHLTLGYSVVSTLTTRLFSSSFQPTDPPGTSGTPMFPGIDFSVAAGSSDAIRRNSDLDSVFVVTGANRGIGFQFVKSLIDRTKVMDL